MQPILPSLPELDMVRYDTEASPERRVWDFFFVKLLLEFFKLGDEQVARGDDRALVGAPGPDLAPARPAEEILYGFQGAYLFSPSQDDDLAFQPIPRKQDGHLGVLLDFPSFAAFVFVKNTKPSRSKYLSSTVR